MDAQEQHGGLAVSVVALDGGGATWSGDVPALFAADFSLSHACWLAYYHLAGWLATQTGMPATLAVLGGLTMAATTMATRAWPAEDPEAIEHDHDDLDDDHEHLADAIPIDGHHHRHTHTYRIDDLILAGPPLERGYSVAGGRMIERGS